MYQIKNEMKHRRWKTPDWGNHACVRAMVRAVDDPSIKSTLQACKQLGYRAQDRGLHGGNCYLSGVIHYDCARLGMSFPPFASKTSLDIQKGDGNTLRYHVRCFVLEKAEKRKRSEKVEGDEQLVDCGERLFPQACFFV